MPSYNITPIAPADDLAVILDDLKNGLRQRATGEGWNNDAYRKSRKILFSHPGLRHSLPEYLVKCRDLDEFWNFIKAKFGTYAERRDYLSSTLNPLLDSLEQLSASFGQFDLGEPIGSGGFGVVYAAKHKLITRQFAIKVFQPAFADGGEDYLARFFQEAGILFELNHPSIIRIHDIGTWHGRPYIVMDYFKGSDLNKVLNQHGRFSPENAILLAQSIAQAMQHAHDNGVVHRDLKPSNVMVSYPKQVRVIDFGLGVYIEPRLTSRLTKSGKAVAGDHFTAPELFANPKLIDPRCDIYSLGAIWYCALTNAVPAGADLVDNLRAVEGLPPFHIEIICKCLASGERRFSSFTEVLNAITNPEVSIGTSQSQPFDCKYVGGDPRFNYDYCDNATATVDPTGVSIVVFEDNGFTVTERAYKWSKRDVVSAFHKGNGSVEMNVKDPEQIIKDGFMVKLTFGNDYYAELFCKRCEEWLGTAPF